MRLTSRLTLAALAGALTIVVATPAQAVPAQTARTTQGVSAAQRDRDLCAQDRTFLRAMHRANLAEIAAGHLALARSSRADVRQIAQQLIEDHTRMDQGTQIVARQFNVELPATPNAHQVKALLAVAARQDRAFDVAWLRLQEAFHERTFVLLNAERAHGCAPEVRVSARAARPIVRQHLTMVRMALRHS
jgi:putative membrane protein